MIDDIFLRLCFQGTLEEIKRWEEFKNRSNKKKFKLYTVRLIVVILVMAILAGSTYAIFKTTEIALESAEVSVNEEKFYH